MNTQAALQQYRNANLDSDIIAEASPHQLINMLLKGVLDNMAQAKGAMTRGDAARKGEFISKGIAIIDSLRASVNEEKGGEIANNLIGLYSYIERRLLEANINSDMDILDEVTGLVKEIKLGWDGIPAEHRNG